MVIFHDETSSVVHYRKIAAMMCLKLSRITMFLQEPSRYSYRSDSCWFRKHCQREDGNFEEKVGMKTNLQPLVLQSKLVILTFWSNTNIGSDNRDSNSIICVCWQVSLWFSRHRACFLRAEVKSPRLIFVSLKRRPFLLITTLISSASELYRMEKMFFEKLLQNEIFKQWNLGDFQTRAVLSQLSKQSWFLAWIICQCLLHKYTSLKKPCFLLRFSRAKFLCCYSAH